MGKFCAAVDIVERGNNRARHISLTSLRRLIRFTFSALLSAAAFVFSLRLPLDVCASRVSSWQTFEPSQLPLLCLVSFYAVLNLSSADCAELVFS